MGIDLGSIGTPPKLEEIKTALFIAPHPDDNEIAAGGTMAYLLSRGARVYGLTATDDRRLFPGLPEDEPSLGQKEAMAAMEALGVENAGFLGFDDKTDAGIGEISAKILEVIRKIQPDAVFGPDPNLENDCHSDHIKVGWAVRQAYMDAECDFFPYLPGAARHEDACPVPILGQFYTDKPNTVVDISAFAEKKYAAIARHESQCEGGLVDLIRMLDAGMAQGTGFAAAERIKLISRRHAHCYPLPVTGNI